MKYNLRFEEMCLYEVEAESEEEALKVPVPTFGHSASISIQSNSGYGKKYKVRNQGKNKLFFNYKSFWVEEIEKIIDKYSASRIMTRTARMLIAQAIVKEYNLKKGVDNETVVP